LIDSVESDDRVMFPELSGDIEWNIWASIQ